MFHIDISRLPDKLSPDTLNKVMEFRNPDTYMYPQPYLDADTKKEIFERHEQKVLDEKTHEYVVMGEGRGSNGCLLTMRTEGCLDRYKMIYF